MSPLPDLAGRRVLVMGLGAFGGGAGCAAALHRLGARVTVTDLRPPRELPEALAALRGLPLRRVLGEHREEDFTAAELVVVNPAVPPDSPWLRRARDAGAVCSSDLELGIQAASRTPALAITGTHGKSTCAALAAWLLRRLPGRTVLAGNLGGSVLERCLDLGPEDRLVLEVSSYQAEALAAPPGWPALVAVTSLGRDHLDRHGSVAAYHAAKRRLLAAQGPDGTLLLPAGLPGETAWRQAARGRVLTLAPAGLGAGEEGWEIRDGTLRERLGGREQPLLPLEAAPFREPYRLPSLLAAVAGCRLLGLPADAVAGVARGFPGLPHRLERLPGPRGALVVDNGVATHPEATAAALRDLAPPVLLLAGGKDKGLPLEDLVRTARGRCRVLHLHGAGGERLGALAREAGLPVVVHPGAREAFQAALADLRPRETLLFSPSFASYDEFRNFADRAAVFRRILRRLRGEGATERGAGDPPLTSY